MTEEWHYSVDGNSTGPISAEAIRELQQNGTLPAETLVWKQGMTDWVPIQTSPEFAPQEQAPAAEEELSPYATPKSFAEENQTPTPAVIPQIGGENSPYGPYEDPSGRAKAAKVGLMLVAGSYALMLIALVHQFKLLGDLNNGVYEGRDADYDRLASINDSAVGGAAILFLICFILSIVFFCRWTHRVSSNAWALQPSAMTTTPGWAVGWYFIPLALLWKPYQAIREVWDVSASANTSGIAGIWWTFWIVGSLADNVTNRLGPAFGDDAGGLQKATALDIGSGIFWIITSFVAMKMVKTLTDEQMKTAQANST